MNLLVLDTATDRCALAVSVDGETFENTRSVPRLHNEYLLEMLRELLETARISPRDLSAIGFAAGPGSFTGIRISAAVCQALAVGAGAQVIPLRSSLLLAHAARRRARRAPAATPQFGVQTVLRSRTRFAYLASYLASHDENLALVADDVLMEDEQLRSVPVPTGWMRVMDASSEQADKVGAIALEPSVSDLLELAAEVLAAGEALPPEGAQPRYVEGDTPWMPH